MEKRVYIINGSGGVGKDSFCALVGLFTPITIASSVTPIKMLARLAGWDGTKDEKGRKFLSDLKDLCTEFNDLPMTYMRNQYESFMGDDRYNVLFLHIREPKEIEKAVKEFNARTILITNSNVSNISSNHADADVYDYTYDVIIDNSGGLDQLRETAETFCKDESLVTL